MPGNDNKPTFRARSLSQVGAVAATFRTQPVDGHTAAHVVDGFAEESGLLDGGLRNLEYGGFGISDAVLHKNTVCVKNSKSFIKCCYVYLLRRPLQTFRLTTINSTNITNPLWARG